MTANYPALLILYFVLFHGSYPFIIFIDSVRNCLMNNYCFIATSWHLSFPVIFLLKNRGNVLKQNQLVLMFPLASSPSTQNILF